MFSHSSKTVSKKVKTETGNKVKTQEISDTPKYLVSPQNIMQLQSTIGNSAVLQLLKSQDPQQLTELPIQRKQDGSNITSNALTERFRKVTSSLTPAPVQRNSDSEMERHQNSSGLPYSFKAGIENLSGIAMDDVRVHYNSNKPSKMGALAYTNGSDIHVASGQERHLPHEAWHVVQQKQGRVQPTMQFKGVEVNDNEELEKEADKMGDQAKNVSIITNPQDNSNLQCKSNQVLQRSRDRKKPSRYNLESYSKSSKFRFARLRRRTLQGMTTKRRAGINLLTVKYKGKDGIAYYFTTRSVPATNSSSFKHPPGHSEQRFGIMGSKFEKRHGLVRSDVVWAASEREPCGHGPGLANCRETLEDLGIPKSKVFYGSPYVDGEDMRESEDEELGVLAQHASEHRQKESPKLLHDIEGLAKGYESEPPSEDESNVVDEYESDCGEVPQERRKRKLNLEGAFRGGFY